MSRSGFWILVALVFCMATSPGSPLAGVAAAEQVRPDSLPEAPIVWSATYASRYCFQGLDYSDGRPVLQPQVSGRIHGTTLAVWGNLDQTRREPNEIDVSLQRDWTLGRSSGLLGYTHLRYPNRDWEPTHEAFVELALVAALEPSLSIHWDVAAGTGRYWAFGVSHEVPWRGGALGLASKLYVHDHYYGLTGIPAVETGVSVTGPWAGISIQPTLARLWTWSNGDFREDQAIRGGWVVSLVCSSP